MWWINRGNTSLLGGEKQSYSSCVNTWQDRDGEREERLHICASRKCNQRQSDDTRSQQIRQRCVLTDLFIKNTCLTLGNYMWSQNTLSPLETCFIITSVAEQAPGCVSHVEQEKKLLLPASPLGSGKQHKPVGLLCCCDDITEKQTFLCPVPLVGFLHPHLRGDRRTPGLPLLSNTARMPPGG